MSIEQGTNEWLEARRAGFGGSEISALYRLPTGERANPWMTQTRLWAEKTGRVAASRPTPIEQPQLYVGTMLEPVVREMFTEFSGRKVEAGVTLHAHPDCPLLIANTDGTQVDVEGRDGPGVYEGKATSAFRRALWYDQDGDPDLPMYVQLQVQHYLGATGLDWGTVCTFFGGDRMPIRWFDIDRHDRIIDDMRERAARWWRDHVVADKPPPIDETAQTEQDLRDLHPRDDGRIILLPEDFGHVLARLDAMEEIGRQAEAERQRLRNLVIAAMGDAAYAEIAGDGRGFTFRLEGKSRKLRTATHKRMDRARRDTGVERPSPVYVPRQIAAAVEAVARVSWGGS